MFRYKVAVVPYKRYDGAPTQVSKLEVLDCTSYTDFDTRSATKQDILKLFENYLSFLRDCRETALMEQGQSAFSSEVGCMINDARNYYNLSRNIIQQRVTSAINTNSNETFIAEKIFLKQLKDIVIKIYGSNNPRVVTEANPTRISVFLQQQVMRIDERLNETAQQNVTYQTRSP